MTDRLDVVAPKRAVGEALIEVRDISKRFRMPSVRRTTVREHALDLFRRSSFDEFTVLDRVSFTLCPGETLGIMGRNGCGKSTLLKIIAGIYRPDSGSIQTRGRITPLLELGIGWNPDLDALDNILLIGSVMGMRLQELRAATHEILAFAELERFARMKLQHFSSGMASRLAYAVAFSAVKEILLLDEIFAVGDAGFRRRCEERFRSVQAAGHSVIMVSHDPRTITEFCDRALLLDRGRIIDEGDPLAICSEYVHLLRGDDATVRTQVSTADAVPLEFPSD